jgi:hypothetical protein
MGANTATRAARSNSIPRARARKPEPPRTARMGPPGLEQPRYSKASGIRGGTEGCTPRAHTGMSELERASDSACRLVPFDSDEAVPTMVPCRRCGGYDDQTSELALRQHQPHGSLCIRSTHHKHLGDARLDRLSVARVVERDTDVAGGEVTRLADQAPRRSSRLVVESGQEVPGTRRLVLKLEPTLVILISPE